MSAIPTTPESKLWELLRRNHCFRKSVARLQDLDAQARRADTADGSRWVGERMVDRFHELNRFAAEALRWLVPNPLFLHRKIVLPSDFKSTDTVVTRETIRLGRNASPQPENGKNWQIGRAHV